MRLMTCVLPRASPATSVSQLRHWLLSTNRLTPILLPVLMPTRTPSTPLIPTGLHSSASVEDVTLQVLMAPLRQPIWCIGDTVSVTYEVTDLCLPRASPRYFGISAPPAVNVNKPDDSYTSACAYADQAAINSTYTDWLAQFSVSGGCNPSGSWWHRSGPHGVLVIRSR